MRKGVILLQGKSTALRRKSFMDLLALMYNSA